MADKGKKAPPSSEQPKTPVSEKKPEPPDMLQPKQLIAAHSGKQYLVESQLGKGGFGEVYKVSLYKNPERKFAMKVERNPGKGVDGTMLRLKVETHVFEEIAASKRVDGKHFVKMHDKGITTAFKYYVMDLIWNSLKDIIKFTLKGNVSLSTQIQIGRQTLQSVKDLHELGFLHRDIKWHNFAVGLPPKDTVIYMLDFGIARPYRDKDGKVKVARATVPFLGTKKYSSIRCMQHLDQGRRDDIETWLYMMIELWDRKNLFFGNYNGMAEILKGKIDLWQNAAKLNKTGVINLPKTYIKMIEYVHVLGYADDVDYSHLDLCLCATFREKPTFEKINLHLPLDWVGKWAAEEEEKKKKALEEEEKRKKAGSVSKMGAVSKVEEIKRDGSKKDDIEEILARKEESKKKDKKKGRRKESKKRKNSRNDDETLITMEDMLDQLNREKKRRQRKASAGATEEDYWKSDEDSEDDYSDKEDEPRKMRKKKSRKRRSRERTRTRDYSDRDEDDEREQTYDKDERDYDKTPHRRRRQKRSKEKEGGGGGGKPRKSTSKLSRKKTYEDEAETPIARIPDPKEPEEDVDRDSKKRAEKEKDKDKEKEKVGSKEHLSNPPPDDGLYVMLGEANAMEKAQDVKDKDKRDREKKDEKSPAITPEAAKKANEAAPAKKEPADPKKK